MASHDVARAAGPYHAKIELRATTDIEIACPARRYGRTAQPLGAPRLLGAWTPVEFRDRGIRFIDHAELRGAVVRRRGRVGGGACLAAAAETDDENSSQKNADQKRADVLRPRVAAREATAGGNG